MVYSYIIDTLGYVPRRLLEYLIQSGVRIVLTPTLEEAFEKTGDRSLAWEGYISTGEYSTTAKTIYVAEGPDDGYGDYTSTNVLRGIAFAYLHLRDPVELNALRESVNYDSEHLPSDLRSVFRRDSDTDSAREMFASCFMHALSDIRDGDLERAFPRTLAFVRKALASFGWEKEEIADD